MPDLSRADGSRAGPSRDEQGLTDLLEPSNLGSFRGGTDGADRKLRGDVGRLKWAFLRGNLLKELNNHFPIEKFITF